MKKNTWKDSLVIGFAMFAVFFGAGNLIFPPQIGLMSGEAVLAGVIGMTLTGILLPMLAVAAVGNMGDNLRSITRHVNPWWHVLYMVLGMFIILFGTIPRAGAVAYETGLLGIFPQLPSYSKWIFLLVFFGISYYFASNKSNVVDRIGKLVTPILLIALVIIVVLTFVNPIGSPGGGSYEHPFSDAFLTAYNTGDVGTGLVCAGIFIAAIRGKGYTEEKEFRSVLFKVIAVSFVILFIVYGGLCYLGSTGTELFEADTDQTALLVGLIQRVAGYGGIVVLSIAIIFACLTTAAGMIATGSDWADMAFKGKVPYRVIALVITLIIFLMASTGASFVIKVSGPIFTFIYPMSIVMTIMGVCKKWVPNDGAWKGAVYVATLFSLYDAFAVARANGLVALQTDGLDRLIGMIPLSEFGFDWLIPSIIGFIAGALIWKALGKESLTDERLEQPEAVE
ncbi:MAG: branched-chain amino acid transport system II carrier protein [Bacillota bacterium]|nr:branched-chain amino acid transport system II carrier protein [Bacillota bacterium]